MEAEGEIISTRHGPCAPIRGYSVAHCDASESFASMEYLSSAMAHTTYNTLSRWWMSEARWCAMGQQRVSKHSLHDPEEPAERLPVKMGGG